MKEDARLLEKSLSSMGKESTCNAGDIGDTGLILRSGKPPRGRKQQRNLVGYSPKGHKESDMTEQLNNTLFFSLKNEYDIE